MRRLYVVGLGPGDPGLITIKGLEALREADTIFIPYSTGTGRSLAMGILRGYPGLSDGKRIVSVGFPMRGDVTDEELRKIGSEVCRSAGSVSAFVVLGDPTLYSTFFRLYRHIIGCFDEIRLIPGVSSVTACAARAMIPLVMGDEAIAIIPANRLDLIRSVKDLFDTIVVIKGNENLDTVANELSNSYEITYAQRCYLNNEVVTRWDPKHYSRDYFSMLICRVKKRD